MYPSVESFVFFLSKYSSQRKEKKNLLTARLSQAYIHPITCGIQGIS